MPTITTTYRRLLAQKLGEAVIDDLLQLHTEDLALFLEQHSYLLLYQIVEILDAESGDAQTLAAIASLLTQNGLANRRST